MKNEISDQLKFFELFPGVLREIEQNFGDIRMLNDKNGKELVEEFLIAAYKNFVEIIETIESFLPFMSNYADYKDLNETAKKLREFIEQYKEIFIKVGIAKEEEVEEKVMKLKAKEAIISKFLTH